MDDKLTDIDDTRPFRTSEIDRVLTVVSGGTAAKLRDDVLRAVDAKLRDQFVDVVNLSSLGALGAPQVMVRVRTLQAILDAFRHEQPENYTILVERVGRKIGFNFGISLIRILRSAKCIPLSFEALLAFWARFDTAAQMGHFVFEYEDKHDGTAVIAAFIKDLFVTLGYGHDEPLRHGALMTGYLVGAADASSLLWTRWLRASVFESPLVSWCALACASVGQEADGISSFVVELRKERLSTVRDEFVQAIDAFETGNAVKAMIDARICLERALLKVAGLAPETHFSFVRLLGQLENVRADLKYVRWKTAYDACSGFAHQNVSHNEIEILEYLFNVWECLQDAERAETSEEQRVSVRSQSVKYVIT